MPEAVLSSLSAKRSLAGRAGAAKRWGNPENRRRVRIDELSPAQRAVVLALIDAARGAKKATVDVDPTMAVAEGQANDRAARSE